MEDRGGGGTVRTSIPQILWCPDLRRYDVEIHMSYDTLFLGDPRPPFTRTEGEYPIQMDFMLYVDGVAHSRTVEDRLVVRKNGAGGIQSISIPFNRLFEGADFSRGRPESEENGYVHCVLRGRKKILTVPRFQRFGCTRKKRTVYLYALPPSCTATRRPPPMACAPGFVSSFRRLFTSRTRT